MNERSEAATTLTLADLRRAATEAATQHRELEADLRVEKAHAEIRAMALPDYAGMKNETERARFLVVALDDDEGYQAIADVEADAHAELDALRTEIEIHEDARRERQMAQRDRELDQEAAELALEVRKFEHHVESEGQMRGMLGHLRDLAGSIESDDGPAMRKVGRKVGRA